MSLERYNSAKRSFGFLVNALVIKVVVEDYSSPAPELLVTNVIATQRRRQIFKMYVKIVLNDKIKSI